MSDSPRRAAERLSLDLQPVTSIQPSSRSSSARRSGRSSKQADESPGLLIARGASGVDEIAKLVILFYASFFSGVIVMFEGVSQITPLYVRRTDR
jgi:hypothetical protein